MKTTNRTAGASGYRLKKRLKTGCVALATGLMSLGAVEAQPVTVEYNKIVMVVTGTAPNEKLEIDREDTRVKSCNQNKPGCVEVSAGNMAEFELRIKQGRNDCAGNDGKWSIQKVLLGGEVAGNDPGDKPGNWGNLSEVAASDFNADAGTGEVKLTRVGNNRAKFYDTNTANYSIWYNVFAELCGTGRTIELDPSVTNRGK